MFPDITVNKSIYIIRALCVLSSYINVTAMYHCHDITCGSMCSINHILCVKCVEMMYTMKTTPAPVTIYLHDSHT